MKEAGKWVYSDRPSIVSFSNLKTFAKWMHQLAPFPLNNPMDILKTAAMRAGLEIERAITLAERRKLSEIFCD